MRHNLLSIGQMAKLNHTTVPTLRLYDRLGLLRPCYTDPATSYRYYDIKQNARYDMIRYMKELGMGLTEIQTVLSKEDVQLIESILIKKREHIFAEIRRLRVQRGAVTRAISNIEHYRKAPTEGVTSLEYIDQRKIYAIPARKNFYEHDIDSYEEVLSDLRSRMTERELPQVYYYNVGTSIKEADFLAQRFVAADLFAFVDEHFPPLPEIRALESGMYACIYTDSYDEEIPCAKKLLEFCRANEYQISGDYICEILTEFNVFNKEQRSMFMRLQVPVSFEIKI